MAPKLSTLRRRPAAVVKKASYARLDVWTRAMVWGMHMAGMSREDMLEHVTKKDGSPLTLHCIDETVCVRVCVCAFMLVCVRLCLCVCLVRVDVPLLMAPVQHWLALGACADREFQVFIREGGWPTSTTSTLAQRS